MIATMIGKMGKSGERNERLTVPKGYILRNRYIIRQVSR